MSDFFQKKLDGTDPLVLFYISCLKDEIRDLVSKNVQLEKDLRDMRIALLCEGERADAREWLKGSAISRDN